MLLTDEDMVKWYDDFHTQAENGNFSRKLVAGAPYTASTNITLTKNNNRTKVTLEHYGPLGYFDQTAQLHRTENVTKMFLDAKKSGALIAEDLNEKAMEWDHKYDLMVYEQEMADGDIREGHYDVGFHTGNMKVGDTEERTRLSLIKGASTRLEMTKVANERENPKVTLHYLWKGKFKKDVCEPAKDLSNFYRECWNGPGGEEAFFKEVERLHDDWIDVVEKRVEAKTTGKAAKRGVSQQNGMGRSS